MCFNDATVRSDHFGSYFCFLRFASECLFKYHLQLKKENVLVDSYADQNTLLLILLFQYLVWFFAKRFNRWSCAFNCFEKVKLNWPGKVIQHFRFILKLDLNISNFLTLLLEIASDSFCWYAYYVRNKNVFSKTIINTQQTVFFIKLWAL